MLQSIYSTIVNLVNRLNPVIQFLWCTLLQMNSIFTPPSGSSKKVTEEPPVADLIDLDFTSQEPMTNHGAGHPTESAPLERYIRSPFTSY